MVGVVRVVVLPCGALEAVGRGEQRAGLDEEPFADRRERDAAARPVEQADAELRLQLVDPLRQRRRGDVQALRGPSEVELLGHGDEVAHAAQVHGPNSIEPDMIGAGLSGRCGRR